MRSPRSLLMLALAGCGAPQSAPDAPVDPVDTELAPVPIVLPEAAEPLSPRAWVVRASLDLRGVRPTADELARVDDDPQAAEALVEAFAADSRFGQRVADMFSEVFLTLSEVPFVSLTYFDDAISRADLYRSIGHEPLQVLARIADEDRSYAELVTGDWTMTNEVLARIWPVAYTPGDTGWRVSHYTDGRPRAGVLASNGMWWQYGSMLNNLNRGRANAFSRIFLCADYLETEIDFNADAPLDSEAALGSAVRTDPACKSCHDSLDPLAAHFFGFWYFAGRKQLPSDAPYYHPDRELTWMDAGLPPAFRGLPTNGLADLGQRTAADAAYARCFVERSLEAMLRRNLTREERPFVEVGVQVFEDSGLEVRALYRFIASSALYRDRAGPDGLKVAAPTVLASQVEQVTGFAFDRGGWNMMQAPQTGLTALAGAVDGVYRTVRAAEPVTTITLVQKRLAESAAMHVVTTDLQSDAPVLLTEVGAHDTPSSAPEAFTAQLQALHLRILSETLADDHPALAEERALWEGVYGIHDSATEAWAAVVTLLLRDPAVVVY